MREQLLRELREARIVAIARGVGSGDILALAGALLAGGVRFLEVPFRMDAPETWPDTAEAIRRVAREMDERVRIGAGTVVDPGQLALAHDAGARFIISPNVDAGIIARTRALGLLSMPGAFTPTEILRAHACGADVVKVFPAGCLGPGYIRDLCRPMTGIALMAVGGVSAENAGAFVAAGAMGVGAGGNLVNREWIASGEYEKITALAAAYVRAVNG